MTFQDDIPQEHGYEDEPSGVPDSSPWAESPLPEDFEMAPVIRVWKYALVPGVTEITLPEGSTFLSVQSALDANAPYIWALIDETKPNTQRYIAEHQTGDQIIEKIVQYFGTVQFQGVLGEIDVHHFFEIDPYAR